MKDKGDEKIRMDGRGEVGAHAPATLSVRSLKSIP